MNYVKYFERIEELMAECRACKGNGDTFELGLKYGKLHGMWNALLCLEHTDSKRFWEMTDKIQAFEKELYSRAEGCR